ncbi:MHCK/EF2 kinase domain family protein [Entamoeba histolytica HM-1:IMSS-B]|uniref:Alpha-type protein kinase domain-containing protein n=5 Tax=Entamoeba histolytica TaxID=5759 RepID=C4M0D9_ENTH1|nr:hypothetical protein EHI_006540 [Entamoeba histolytica HM-1:IMSS]EMD49147.1 elongation factor 2 kinase, putative [Entamoeba histolytica KU27]EMH74059.1 MHCK/EF2 kinase domain family protein [Entamoeba histolytica HM-1:IMSS-B]ENY64858.1 elongation factor 2 kinase, putative [Entamoeba histolytica HM-1:IMSS-A]GAT94623.1 hypothetical protein CL6EHI_006540 [Entamoeba histolytica]EAL49091.1 hypothetical protein EHI_006540 [Entamoeba histolytica HM-1:IMSS]|eukprot:XP_654482.1 hypothetical protein EHI_006540 [Entamoeba histolytica HM-1:IMSS]
MESDFNDISKEQFEESIVRMKTYESIATIYSGKKKQQSPEYQIISYLNSIENEGKDKISDITFIVERNSQKNINIINEKIMTLIKRYSTMRFGFIQYYIDEFNRLCCSHPQFIEYEKFNIEEYTKCFIDENYNKENILQIPFNDIITKVINVDWRIKKDGKKVIILFDKSPININKQTKEIMEQDNFIIDQFFVFITQKYDNKYQQQFNEETIHCKKIQHICWNKFNLNECLINKLWFNKLLDIDIKNTLFDDKLNDLRIYINERLMNQEKETMNGITISIPKDYINSNECYKSYGVSTTVEVQPSQLKVDLKCSGLGRFKIMHQGLLNNKEEVAVKYDHDIINNTFDNYIGILESYSVTKKFLNEFNSINASSIECVNIKLFVPTTIPLLKKNYTISEIRQFIKGKNIFLIEPLLKEQFTYWNKNDGKVNLENYSASLNCFSHFTYVRSGRRLLISDIQGVIHEQNYLLTDMAIHHEMSCRFGCSGDNHRFNGMNKFLQKHICNNVCFKLKLNGIDTFEADEEAETKCYITTISQ